MRFSNLTRALCSFFMAAIMTNVPATAWSEQSRKLIPTSEVVSEISREQAQQEIEKMLSQDEVREALLQQGLTETEINSRLAALSTTEMQQLASQMQQARAGGNILVTVLVVVLIIYLIRRI